MIYKVWIHVEEIDEENDHYEDITEPVEVARFANEIKAIEFADTLENEAAVLQGIDP